MSIDDIYCPRCDVFGHEYGTEECYQYWISEEHPFLERMKKQIGKVFKLGKFFPELTDENGVAGLLPEGTYVKLVDYVPWQEGRNVGNYWTISTLDGKYSATQVYQDELVELDALDRLALLEHEKET